MSSKLKIIYYSPHPTHDIVSEVGYSTHQRETINSMRLLGHDVVPVILGGTEKASVEAHIGQLTQKSKLKKLLLKILPLPVINALKDYSLLQHDKRAAATLAKAIEEHKPDLVYERGEYLQNKGTVLCKKRGIRHFLEVNSPCVQEMRGFEGPSLIGFLGHWKEASKIKNTNHIICVSSALKEFIQKRYKPTVDIQVEPNCINPEKEQAAIQSDFKAIENVDVSNKKIIGFVGSIFPHHGVDELIEAFQEVRSSMPEAFLLIIGDGILRPGLEEMAIRQLPVGSYLFTGKIPHSEIMNWIALFDVAVMPNSNWYGSPIKVLEYGLMKKPVVAPDLGPLRDLAVNDKEAFLFTPGISNLSQTLLKVLQNEEKSQRVAVDFYHKIMDKFTWEKQTERILSSCL